MYVYDIREDIDAKNYIFVVVLSFWHFCFFILYFPFFKSVKFYEFPSLYFPSEIFTFDLFPWIDGHS